MFSIPLRKLDVNMKCIGSDRKINSKKELDQKILSCIYFAVTAGGNLVIGLSLMSVTNVI